MVEFWLTKGSDAVRLPVNPPSISVSTGYSHSEVQISALGDISFPQGVDLVKYSFTSFFLVEYNTTYCEYMSFPAPFEFVEKIKNWVDIGEPVRLTVTQSPINTLVTIRSFQFTPWEHGDNDIPYSLSLVEYKEPVLARTVVVEQVVTKSIPQRTLLEKSMLAKGKR